MSINVKQSLVVTLYGDGSSTTFLADLNSSPFTNNSFNVGSPDSISVVLSSSPRIVGVAPQRLASTFYPVGFVVASSSNVFQFQVSTAGTTSSQSTAGAFPNPPILGQTFGDGSVTWTTINAFPTNVNDSPELSVILKKSVATISFSSVPLLYNSV